MDGQNADEILSAAKSSDGSMVRLTFRCGERQSRLDLPADQLHKMLPTLAYLSTPAGVTVPVFEIADVRGFQAAGGALLLSLEMTNGARLTVRLEGAALAGLVEQATHWAVQVAGPSPAN